MGHSNLSIILLLLGISSCFVFCIGENHAKKLGRNQEECKVEDAMLIKILGLLKSAQESIQFPINATTSSFPFKTETKQEIHDCLRIVTLIATKLESIIEDAQKLYRAVIIDTPQYQIIYSSLEAKLANFISTINQLEAFLAENLEGLWEQLELKRDDFVNLVRNRMGEADYIKNYNDVALTMVISLIQLGKYSEAEKTFQSLKNDSLRDTLTDELFSENSFEHLAGYVNHFPMAQHATRVQILERWYDNSDKAGLSKNYIIILLKALKDEEKRVGSSFSDHLKVALTKIISTTDTLTSGWVSKIILGSSKDIIDFGSPGCLSFVGNCFEEVLPDLISKALISTSLDKCLNFVLALRWNSHKYIGLEKIMSFVSTQSHLDQVKVASAVKLAMTSLTGPDSESSAMSKFNSLKSSLNQNLRCFVWHKSISLRNVDHNMEYLYIANEAYVFDGVNKRVLTWTPGASVFGSEFQFVNVPNDTSLTVRIESVAYPGWFITKKGNNYDDEGAYVSAKLHHFDDWVVEFYDTDHFRIKHLITDTYLYASEHLYIIQRRYPFLWLAGGPTSDSVWKVECQEA